MGKRRSLRIATTDQTCRGKKIYGNKKLADGAAARSRARTGEDNIEAYKCPSRSHYHVGHQRTFEERRERALANGTIATVSYTPEGSRVPGSVDRGKVALTRVGTATGRLPATITETEEGV